MSKDNNVIPEKVIELIRNIFSKNDPIMNGGLDFEILDNLFIKKESITKIMDSYINKIKTIKSGEKS